MSRSGTGSPGGSRLSQGEEEEGDSWVGGRKLGFGRPVGACWGPGQGCREGEASGSFAGTSAASLTHPDLKPGERT